MHVYGVAVADWVFGVRLVCRCVEKRGYCVGKRLLCRGVSRISEGRGGVVPNLCFNRYMSWEGGGIAFRLWLYTKSGGGGCARVAAFHLPWEGQPLPPPPPRPGLTGNRGRGGPCNMSLATRQIRARSGFPHLHNKI